MVCIEKMSFEGLLSFGDRMNLNVFDHTVIVGPNNSGKSNLFKIIKILVDSFYGRSRIDNSKMSIGKTKASLTVTVNLSEPEIKRIVDFFSFHPDEHNDVSVFHEFENYATLTRLLDRIEITLTWRREVEGAELEPYAEIEFTKIGLKMFNYIHSDFRISHVFPKNPNDHDYKRDIRLADLLDMLTLDSPTTTVTKFFKEHGVDIGIPHIKFNRNKDHDDQALDALRRLYSYLEISISSGQEIRFSELFGTILRRGIYFSEGRINQQSILDLAESLKLSQSESVGIVGEKNERDFNQVLDERAHEKAVEFNDFLYNDGSNLTNYLFSLKNSPRQSDRDKFSKIRTGFTNIFKPEKLDFDVFLQYEFPLKFRVWHRSKPAKPEIPTIMVLDDNLGQQLTLDRVGSGIEETIYILTLAYGVENSVILLDEPTVNIHPTLMKTIFKELQNHELNQFLVITHSPELTNYELFEEKANLWYVRRSNNYSEVRTFDDKTSSWFDEKRYRLRHLIDSKIFFARCVILTEGESDKNLLSGIADYYEFETAEIDLTKSDIIITSANSKDNFKKYQTLLESLGISFIILADGDDAKKLFPIHSTVSAKGINGNNSVYVIEGGDLEHLMREIDSEIYSSSVKENGKSKPAVAFEFTRSILSSNPSKIDPIKSILIKSTEKTGNSK